MVYVRSYMFPRTFRLCVKVCVVEAGVLARTFRIPNRQNVKRAEGEKESFQLLRCALWYKIIYKIQNQFM